MRRRVRATFVRIQRQWHDHTSDRRTVQGAYRYRHCARPLPHRRAIRARRHGRPHTIHLRQHYLVVADDPRRPAPRSRHHDQPRSILAPDIPTVGNPACRASKASLGSGLRRLRKRRSRSLSGSGRTQGRARRQGNHRQARRDPRRTPARRDRKASGAAGRRLARWKGILSDGKIKLQ